MGYLGRHNKLTDRALGAPQGRRQVSWFEGANLAATLPKITFSAVTLEEHTKSNYNICIVQCHIYNCSKIRGCFSTPKHLLVYSLAPVLIKSRGARTCTV